MKLEVLVGVVFSVCCASGCRRTAAAGPDALIPLQTLLAPASIDAPELSPDGKSISYIAPVGGARNLCVAPLDDLGALGAARPLTHRTGRGIQPRDVSDNVLYRWSAGGTHLIFPEDRDGDENWSIHAVDVLSGEERNLTPIAGARAEIVRSSPSIADEILVRIREPGQRRADLHRLNIRTGAHTLVAKDQGFLRFVGDHELKPRIGVKATSQGGLSLYRWSGDGPWQPFFDVGSEDLAAFHHSSARQITRFDRDNDLLYFYDSQGRDTNALVGVSLSTGQKTVLASHAKVDLAGVLFHPTTDVPQAYATNWMQTEWHVLDQALADDFTFLRGVADGELAVVSRSASDECWLVRYASSHAPDAFYLYQRAERRARKLFTATPQLEGLPLSRFHPVVIKSRDGFDLVSYLMLPRWTDLDDDGRPAEPLPMTVLVHGGPSDERAECRFTPYAQWLANRGYAVLYVNFRGSPGFGKAFMNAQNLEWGGKMNDDLIDQVNWAITEKIAARDRVAIMGGSYGGYAVLVALTMTPDVFACGVDLVGPSSLEQFLPHWNVELLARTIGDPRTPAGRAHLRARSPIHFAHQIKRPLLIGQGANDARVPRAQSDAMVETMVKHGAKVVYLLYPDEGHGFLRPANKDSFWAITEVFLAQCLGGRCQPIVDQLAGSSLQVKVGAEHIPGLAEALAR